jgi:DegV family protein with EDD domain
MVKIVTDSTADLSLEEVKKLGVEFVPLKVNFGEKSFFDKIELTSEEFFKKLTTEKNHPTTTLANPDQFVQVFNKYPKDDIIVITLSSKLSGTFQSANLAKNMVDRQNIHLVDTGSVSMGVNLIVREAVKMVKAGKSAKQTFDALEALVKKLRVIAVFDTLKYLVKGGRVSAAKALVAQVANLKPIMGVKDGVISSVGKSRGVLKSGMEVLRIIDTTDPLDPKYPVVFGHTMVEENLNAFKKVLLEKYKVENVTTVIGSVVGTHAGPGAYGIGYISK